MTAQKESRDALNEALHLCIKKSQWSDAVAILRKLMRLEPANTMYLLRVGDYSAKIGAKKEAVAAYLNAGDAFSRNGFLVKAIAAYKMILNLEPNHPEARGKLQALHAETRGRTNPKMILDLPSPPPSVPTTPATIDAGSFESIPPEPVGSSPSFSEGARSLEEINAEQQEKAPLPAKKLAGEVIPLFANLTPEEFARVVEGTTPRSHPPGSFIVREGEKEDSIYIIVKGRAKVVTNAGDQEIILGLLNEGDFFGEVAFLTGRPRTANVIALFETDLLELPGETVRALLVQYPHIRQVLESLYMRRMQITIDVMKSAKGAL